MLGVATCPAGRGQAVALAGPPAEIDLETNYSDGPHAVPGPPNNETDKNTNHEAVVIGNDWKKGKAIKRLKIGAFCPSYFK